MVSPRETKIAVRTVHTPPILAIGTRIAFPRLLIYESGMVVSCHHLLDMVSRHHCEFVNFGKHYIHSRLGGHRTFRLIAYFVVAHKFVSNVNGIEI